MKNELSSLKKYARKEKYPYELGAIRGFALSLINGDDSRLVDEFRMRSAGQGVNSRTNYLVALGELQEIPGLLESLDNQIPFPALFWDKEGASQIVVEVIPIQVALERVSRFS